MLTDTKEVKEVTDEQVRDQEYGTLVNILSPAVTELSKQTSAVVAMKMARQKILAQNKDGPQPKKKARKVGPR